MTQIIKPSAADLLIHHVSEKPKWLIYGICGVVTVFAWGWLITMTAGISSFVLAPTLGPGMQVLQPFLDTIAETINQSSWLTLFVKFCTPQASVGANFAIFMGTFFMWCAMSFAMMLPSALPMLRTYSEISETAGKQNRKTVPTYILALGYFSIWIGFSLLAATSQMMLVELGWAKDTILPIGNLLAGMLLVTAGLYQFSPLKEACLHKCRNPFTTLFGHWSEDPVRIYRLGLKQGLYCLGCCWALMLIMLVVGTMNLAWMAFLTIFALVEKTGKGKVTSRTFAVILLLWGGILISLSL
ncbi:MAG: hypothetical protein COC23_03405 [Hyphomicrobiales bacterium]|nr:MAG: hypothetical protein COC23_03405 [Hyphomicrobiales bacterium]